MNADWLDEVAEASAGRAKSVGLGRSCAFLQSRVDESLEQDADCAHGGDAFHVVGRRETDDVDAGYLLLPQDLAESAPHVLGIEQVGTGGLDRGEAHDIEAVNIER